MILEIITPEKQVFTGEVTSVKFIFAASFFCALTAIADDRFSLLQELLNNTTSNSMLIPRYIRDGIGYNCFGVPTIKIGKTYIIIIVSRYKS